MLTFPVANSTSWTWPGVLPGNAMVLEVKQHKPKGLSAVSKADHNSGGLEKVYTRTLFCSATKICVLDNRTPCTDV